MTRYRDAEHAELVRKKARIRAALNYADPVKRETIWARTRANRKTKSLTDRLAALAHYGPGCQCCGEIREPFLVIGHIDGGGNAHRAMVVKARQGARGGGGPYFYRWLRLNGYPTGFQVLCANCNMAKDRPGGCPHQTTEEVIESA